MRSVIWGTLRTQARRYVAAAVAVVVSVMFLVVTNALTSATRDGLLAGLEVPYEHADVVVSDVSGSDAAGIVDRARTRGDAAAVLGWTIQPVTAGDRLVGERVDVGAVADDPALRWQELTTGRLPGRSGEAVADVNAAKSAEVEVGDVLRVGTGRESLEVRLVGLVDTPSASVGASLYLPWPDTARWSAEMQVDSVAYDDRGASADAGATGDTDALTAELSRQVPGAQVSSVDAFLVERSAALTQGVNVIAVVLLLFGALALGVSVLVIANTFGILFAQRRRDFALVRCVGATRRQLVRAVRVEALTLGVAASLVGVGAGAAAGVGLVAAISALWPTVPLGAVDLSPAWLLGAAAVGVTVTWLASWLPVRRVARTTPLAALRPDEAAPEKGVGPLRVGVGALLLLAGAAALIFAAGADSAQAMVLGGGLAFTGVLVVGPLLVPALISLLGRGAARFQGPAARLAAADAVRHPKRTATTTAALLVGVTLTTAVLTGLASSRDATTAEMAEQYPVDVAMTAEQPLDAALLEEVRSTPGVAAADAVPGVLAEISSGGRSLGRLPVVARPADAEAVHGTGGTPPAGDILLPPDVQPGGSTVTVRSGERRVQLTAGYSESWGEAALVAPATLSRLGGTPATHAIWVRAADDADAEDLTGDLTALSRSAEAGVASGLSRRAYVDLQLDVLTLSVVGLLAVAIVIALVGIANTLGLSVVERGREHALLRALGLTRGQLRRMLATEGVLLSVVATLLGSAIGVVFAWVGVLTLVEPAIGSAVLVVPWWQLAAVAAVGAVAGLLAALLPSRRAARVTPAAGLSLD